MQGGLLASVEKQGSSRNVADYAHKLATALTIGWRERDGLSGGDVRW